MDESFMLWDFCPYSIMSMMKIFQIFVHFQFWVLSKEFLTPILDMKVRNMNSGSHLRKKPRVREKHPVISCESLHHQSLTLVLPLVFLVMGTTHPTFLPNQSRF
jgi:hypothetical protein